LDENIWRSITLSTQIHDSDLIEPFYKHPSSTNWLIPFILKLYFSIFLCLFFSFCPFLLFSIIFLFSFLLYFLGLLYFLLLSPNERGQVTLGGDQGLTATWRQNIEPRGIYATQPSLFLFLKFLKFKLLSYMKLWGDPKQIIKILRML
jgi:hypothetical protein